MAEIRLLEKEDIEVRVAQTFQSSGFVKVNLLLYKNARVDMKILDELFTPMGWKRTHRLIGDRLYCCVEVYNPELHEWISKEDVGVESNTEAEKGQASDSFKRACVNWGIGRELYTAPRIVVTLKDDEYTRDQNSRIKVWASFSVKSIDYDKNTRTITSLEIEDKNGLTRFTYGNAPVAKEKKSEPSPAVQARRKAKETSPKPEYKPLPEGDYWKIVKAHAEGKKTKVGGDYKQTWIEMTNADAEAILKFEEDVQVYRYNLEQQKRQGQNATR